MKKVILPFISLTLILVLVFSVNAANYCTRTQGGTGSVCPPSAPPDQPGCFRNTHFTSFSVGIGNSLTFNNAAALESFLPQGGTPAVLTQTYTNPSNLNNVLAGQVTTLKFWVLMSHLGSTPSGLGSLVIASPGPFTGLTVNQFLEIAEKVLGGLSSDFTPSEVNHQADLINNAQDAGSLTGDCVPCNPEVFQCGPTVVLKPKLEITKVASLTHVSIGQEIIYTITVTNTGNAPALDVVLIDTEDPQLAFVSANPAPMIVSGNINTGYALTWNVGTILPGEFKVFSVTKKLGLLAVHNSVLHDFVTATSINADPVQASAAVTVENAPPVGPPRTPGYWKQQTCGTKAAKFSQIQIQQFLNLISVSTIVPQLQSLTPSQACALLSTLDNANPLEKLLKFLLNNWLNLAANFIEPNSYYSFSSPDFSGFDSTIKKKSENDILNNAQADVLLYDKDVLDEIANSGSNSVSVVPYQTVSSSWFNPDFAIATMGILGIVVFGLFFLSRRDMAGHKK